MFIGYIEGYTITDEINYCPACGTMISEYHADGTATCTNCGRCFDVLAVDGEEKEVK